MMGQTDIVDFGNHPEIYADGIGDVVMIGPNLHLFLFRWRKLDGVLRRCMAAELIRPIISFTEWQLASWREIYPTMSAASDMLVH